MQAHARIEMCGSPGANDSARVDDKRGYHEGRGAGRMASVRAAEGALIPEDSHPRLPEWQRRRCCSPFLLPRLQFQATPGYRGLSHHQELRHHRRLARPLSRPY